MRRRLEHALRQRLERLGVDALPSREPLPRGPSGRDRAAPAAGGTAPSAAALVACRCTSPQAASSVVSTSATPCTQKIVPSGR
jgi:hypothetical protein